MNLLRWITHKMVILILFVMFCALITSSYDSTDDVLCTHRIVVWFYWWCSVHTSHRRMIPLTMFCTCIALALWFHRWCSVYTSHRIMILLMMFWVHVTSHYDSIDDNNSYNPSRLWFQKWIHMYTRHRVMIPQMIPCVHVALQPMIQWSFCEPK